MEPTTTSRSRTGLRPARVAVGAVFFLNGAGFATWASRIPAVQDRLGLSEGALGAALLGASVGLVLAVPLAAALVGRIGSRRVVIGSVLSYCVVLPFLALAPNLPALAAALFAFGGSNASLDLSMNVQATAVERGYGRSIMTAFHALFSLGALAGAGAGAAVAALGIGPFPHLLVAAAALGVSAVIVSRPLLREREPPRTPGPTLVRPTRVLAWPSVIAFCILLSEGAMYDWSAVYLYGVLGTSQAFAAVGFGVFAAAMTAGRLAGDRLTDRFGSTAVVRGGALLGGLGLAAGLLLPFPAAAVAAFACLGLGLASGFPLVLSASGRAPGVRPQVAIAAATTAGYTGFLAGPPVIGFLAEAAGLRAGLGIVVACAAAVVALAGRLRAFDR